MMRLVRVFTGLVILVPVGKEIQLNRKTPAHLAGYVIRSRPRVMEEVESCWLFQCIRF